MTATSSLADKRCEAATDSGDACPEAPSRHGDGVPMCEGHYREHHKRQTSKKNAKHAASSRLTKPQVQALREGLSALAEAAVDHSAATTVYEATLDDPEVDQRFNETREALVEAVEEVLVDWWKVLPEGFNFAFDGEDADSATG